MPVTCELLSEHLNILLDVKNYPDYGSNGLQVEGKNTIGKIAFAVSATTASVQAACDRHADVLLTWHTIDHPDLFNYRHIKSDGIVRNPLILCGFHWLSANGDASMHHIINPTILIAGLITWIFHEGGTITGTFVRRIKLLIGNQINPFGFHLPLDDHVKLGNTTAIADLLGLQDRGPFREIA